MRRAALASIAGALLATGALLPAAQVQTPEVAGFQTFEGAWSASGERRTLPGEDGRSAAIVQLSGAVVLTGGAGLSRGFRGEVIGFDDGRNVVVGRWVWTDDRGDRIFGDVKGEPVATGRRFVGIITGGSGRYAGISGEYEFTWQFVVASEGDAVHGRTSGLKGRYRR